MAASDVAISNIALTMLSENRINSLTEEGNENAAKINAIYTHTRDSLLAEHNWNFARTQKELSLLSTGPVLTNWTSSFQLPSDCIRVIRMDGDTPFSIYGTQLYTNATEAKIDYIKQVTDEGIFSPAFVKCFAARIAMEISYGSTESATVYKLIAERYKVALQEAKWADSQEGFGTEVQHGRLLDNR